MSHPAPAAQPAARRRTARVNAHERRWRLAPLAVLRFDNHFFADRDIIALDGDELAILLDTARAGWARVGPSIFGTIPTRGLGRDERRGLGAEFTPRAWTHFVGSPS
jgi:hypothetical protein